MTEICGMVTERCCEIIQLSSKQPKHIAIAYSIHLSILFIFLGQIGAMLPIWHILTIVVCVLNVLYWNSLENQW